MFELRLPLADMPVDAKAPHIQSREDPAGVKSLRVLVVDDNADLAASTAALLEIWGHEVRAADNGRDVHDAALSSGPM